MVFARIIRDVVIPRPQLSGLYHVAATPINKLDLLRMIADIYGKEIDIVPDETLIIDRSLDPARFSSVTGYLAPGWPDLIKAMHTYR